MNPTLDERCATPAASGPVVRTLTESDAFDHDLCRRLSRDKSLPGAHGRWPDRGPSGDVALVGVVDDLVVGRAILEAPYLPYAELINLCVRPDYRRRGVASAIVAEAIQRARRLGCKVLTVQQYREDAQADGIYRRHGFLPATVGEFQRLVCLLDVPIVSLFRLVHPDAPFASEPDSGRGEHWWRMAWADGGERVALSLHGGSCQFDSDGFQPVIGACELVTAEAAFAAELTAAPRVQRGETLALTVTVKSLGAPGLDGRVRAMLLPETEVTGPASLASAAVTIRDDEQATVELPVRIRHEFRTDGQRFVSYPSAPFTVELAWEGGSVLLSAAVIVA